MVVASLLVGVAGTAAFLLAGALSFASWTPAPSPRAFSSPLAPSMPSAGSLPAARGDLPGALRERDGAIPGGPVVPRPEHRAPLGHADGVLPDRVSVVDGRYPGVANLDPLLLVALRQAAPRAASDGVQLLVTSGWRSRRYQEQLFRQAVSEYGSKEKAAEWVASPGTSAHEAGKAVDIGPVDAAAWLSEHGAEYGLCQVYRNEPWHYELRPEAIDGRCPRMYADPTSASRMLP